MLRRPAALGCLALALVAAAPATARAEDFAAWLAELRAEALAQGISPATVESALADVAFLPRVLELDRTQPRDPVEFCGYLERRLTPTRIARAQEMLAEHRALLDQLNAEYGVPPRYLVSIWGLETNFGDYLGDFRVLDALATLARDSRRGEAFREQLLAALRIIDEGHQVPNGFLGSWAGATGQVQFMPTTFLRYAVDHDGDGRKDVWQNVGDSLASAANYLRRSGWRPGQSWGRPVRLPANLPDGQLRESRPLSEWQRRGVRGPDGEDLPSANLSGAIVLPRREPDPAFLVYRNYRTFLAWNRSTFFAISLGALADRVSERPSPRLCGL